MPAVRSIRAWVTVLACASLAACGGHSNVPPATAPSGPPPASAVPSTPTVTAPNVRTRRPSRHHPRVIDPGTLPQTHALPSAHTPAFSARMRLLWRAIQAGAPQLARPAFFPESAYAQLKAVGDPGSDFEDRLFADFRLDVAAAHALLGPDAGQARLVAIDVPGQDAHWVAPDVCLNRDGYYEVPNARLVYSLGGATRSFGIASMISWRGEWYVVHLGAVVRKVMTGIVDDPSTGPGVSVASSTC